MRMKDGESGFTLLVEGNTMKDEGGEARGISSDTQGLNGQDLVI